MEIKKEKRNGLMYAKYNGELISAEIAEEKKNTNALAVMRRCI